MWKFWHRNLRRGALEPAGESGLAIRPAADSGAPPGDEVLGPSRPAATGFDDDRPNA
jgi:hypothetical protein